MWGIDPAKSRNLVDKIFYLRTGTLRSHAAKPTKEEGKPGRKGKTKFQEYSTREQFRIVNQPIYIQGSELEIKINKSKNMFKQRKLTTVWIGDLIDDLMLQLLPNRPPNTEWKGE